MEGTDLPTRRQKRRESAMTHTVGVTVQRAKLRVDADEIGSAVRELALPRISSQASNSCSNSATAGVGHRCRVCLFSQRVSEDDFMWRR